MTSIAEWHEIQELKASVEQMRLDIRTLFERLDAIGKPITEKPLKVRKVG